MKFVEEEMNGCTEVAAAQAQVREWARQVYNKQNKRNKKRARQSPVGPQSRTNKHRAAAQAAGNDATGAVDAVGAVGVVVVSGVTYPLSDAGPKPSGCKLKAQCKKCNQWGHGQGNSK